MALPEAECKCQTTVFESRSRCNHHQRLVAGTGAARWTSEALNKLIATAVAPMAIIAVVLVGARRGVVVGSQLPVY